MSKPTGIFDEEINRLLCETSESLPNGYEVRISIENGECSIYLFRPDGNAVEVCTDDCDFSETLAAHVKVAKEHEYSHHDPR